LGIMKVTTQDKTMTVVLKKVDKTSCYIMKTPNTEIFTISNVEEQIKLEHWQKLAAEEALMIMKGKNVAKPTLNPTSKRYL